MHHDSDAQIPRESGVCISLLDGEQKSPVGALFLQRGAEYRPRSGPSKVKFDTMHVTDIEQPRFGDVITSEPCNFNH